MKPRTTVESLLSEIRACTACSDLPLGPRPVLRASSTARLLLIGQAPGTRVHSSGIPWNDPSGNRLRDWLELDRSTFYDESQIAIVPMGFCYPGKGKSGDLPPRRECAQLWHPRLFPMLREVRLTLLIGAYSQAFVLGPRRKNSLTETVRAFEDYLPQHFVLPHPSARNTMWLKRNPWFATDCLPRLRRCVRDVFAR